MPKKPQLELLKKEKSAYGGELFRTRAGRSTPRPLDTRNSMHLVLKSSKAKGKWSFRYQSNPQRIRVIVKKFATRYGIQILHGANVGNHLHLHIRLRNRRTYAPFIRAVTSAIAMAVTGTSRWRKDGKPGNATRRVKAHTQQNLGTQSDTTLAHSKRLKFWDYRPFSRVIVGLRAILGIRDYIKINRLEGEGVKRETAVALVRGGRPKISRLTG